MHFTDKYPRKGNVRQTKKFKIMHTYIYPMNFYIKNIYMNTKITLERYVI